MNTLGYQYLSCPTGPILILNEKTSEVVNMSYIHGILQSWGSKPLRIGPAGSLKNLLGNSVSIVSCQSLKSQGSLI